MHRIWTAVLRFIGYPVDDAATRPATPDSDARSVESDAPGADRALVAAGADAVANTTPDPSRPTVARVARRAALRADHRRHDQPSTAPGLAPMVANRRPPPEFVWPATRGRAAVTEIGNGRKTTDTAAFATPRAILPPPDHLGAWRMEDLDSNTLDKRGPAEILDLLANLSPEVSRALWDFLRLTNAGYEFHAYRPGTERVDKRAEAALTAFFDVLKDHHGSVDVVVNRLFIGAFMRGALFAELVLDPDGKAPVDIATPDPATVRFRLIEDPERGQVWQLGQRQRHALFVPLDDRPTIKYIPIDPFPGSPYGRPLVSPALFSTLFLVGLLHDLRRVISQQGYPRIDVVVMIDKIISRMPPENRTDQEQVEKWIEAAVRDIRDVYKNLQPDDALVHDDGVEVKGPIGTVDSSSLGSIDGVIAMLERMAVRALKSMPLMMGITDGVSEANANRQWEIFIAGIKSVQHHAETLLERLLELSLQCQGIVADVRFRFSEVRSAEELRDQQTLAAKIENYARMRNEGWIAQDEASNAVVGHDAELGEPVFATVNGDAVSDENPEPGSKRSDGVPTERDLAAFRDLMASEGFVRLTEYAPVGKRPPTEPGASTMQTGVIMVVGQRRYVEWDCYSRPAPAAPTED